MRKLVFSTLMVLTSFASIGVVFADDKNNTVEGRAQERLQNIEERVASDSAKKSNNSGKFKKDHFNGTISAISATTLSVNSGLDTKSVLTLSTTVFLQLGSAKTTIKFSDLKVNDRIVVYGVAKSEPSGIAVLIARLTQKNPIRKAIFGRISALSSKEVTLVHIRKTEETIGSAVLSTNTVYKSKELTITLSELKIGDVVAVSATADDKGILTAKLVQKIPGLGLLKTATSSATPSAR